MLLRQSRCSSQATLNQFINWTPTADMRQSPYTCMLPKHKPVRRGREMIDLLAVEEPKPKPAKIPAVLYEAAIEPVVQTHAVV